MHNRGMNLAEYMRRNGINDEQLAARVGRARTTVMRWRRGVTRPDWAAVAALERATGGAVTASDFVEPQPGHHETA
ncbi:MAG: XRE family transcriptional regulator [Alphaproteobacteria bacterium]|nr:MAG: XRE family transcriptional regulator [Alphaproteobacteria bacterium]